MPSDLTPPGRPREPAFAMPGGLVAAIAVLLLIHAARAGLSDLTDLRLVLDLGFVPSRLSVAIGWTDVAAAVQAAGEGLADPEVAAARGALAGYVLETGGARPWTLLTYAVLHGSWMHVGLNCLWLAAFGTPVLRRLGALRALALAAASSVAGALLFWVLNPLGSQVLIGASGAVSGFMGAAALFVFATPAIPGLVPPRGAAAAYGRLLRNRSALMFLGIWFVMNLVVGLLGGPLGIVEGGIAWEAHIGGLLAGLLLFPLLDPA